MPRLRGEGREGALDRREEPDDSCLSAFSGPMGSKVELERDRVCLSHQLGQRLHLGADGGRLRAQTPFACRNHSNRGGRDPVEAGPRLPDVLVYQIDEGRSCPAGSAPLPCPGPSSTSSPHQHPQERPLSPPRLSFPLKPPGLPRSRATAPPYPNQATSGRCLIERNRFDAGSARHTTPAGSGFSSQTRPPLDQSYIR